MESSQQAAVTARVREGSVAAHRQRRSIAEKRRIVEETLAPDASVAQIARAHGVNVNQVFGWRRSYLAGRLKESFWGDVTARRNWLGKVFWNWSRSGNGIVVRAGGR